MNENRRFLEEIDYFIKENLRTLTCSQIYEFYFRFFYDLKDFKGNSNGFTGLSEYLIFRSIFHLLGGSFSRKNAFGSNWISEFESTDDNNICIGQSIPIRIDHKKIYPDITVHYTGRLRGNCSDKNLSH
jgi:hypothetical protein